LRHERATEELRESAALYALGSLTQQEARSLEIHVEQGCSVCSSELERFQHAAAGIGLAAAEVAAPEYIRDLLAARIEREPQSAPPPSQPRPHVTEKPVEEFPRSAPVTLSLHSEPKKDGPRVLPWILVVALVMLGLVAVYLWRSALDTNNRLQVDISAARSDAESIRSELGIRKEEAGKLGKILDSVGKPGVRIARLIVQTAPPASLAVLIWDTEQSQCLVLGNFPPAPEGKRYQLWLFSPTAKVPAGFLKTNPAGGTFISMPVPQEAVNASAAVVTLEPDNGSQIPTSPYYAAGRID
jgi:hypothetical protein